VINAVIVGEGLTNLQSSDMNVPVSDTPCRRGLGIPCPALVIPLMVLKDDDADDTPDAKRDMEDSRIPVLFSMRV
jgi:hypothetical protein